MRLLEDMLGRDARLDAKRVTVVEWYDGIVSAVVDLRENATYLCSLLAWHPQHESRVFVVIPLVVAEAQQLRDLLGETPNEAVDASVWRAIAEMLDRVRRSYSGSVIVFAADDLQSTVSAWKAVDARNVPELETAALDAEGALSEARLRHWLSLLGSPNT